MEAKTLGQILTHAPGVEGSDSTYEVSEGHRLSFYIGQDGQAMVLGDILKVELHEGFIHLVRKEADGSMYFGYHAVHGIAIRPPDEVTGRKAGFS